MSQVWDRESAPRLLSLCHNFWRLLCSEQPHLKRQLVRQAVSCETSFERREDRRCQFTILSVESAARCQRYLSEVPNNPLAAPIAAAITWRGSCPHPIWSGRVPRLPALPAAAGRSAVIVRPVPPETPADGARRIGNMEPIDLDPRYSTSDVPGKCIKCLAEQELEKCLLELMRAGSGDKALAQRFEMLVSFLKSPESQKLRDESERYLAEGKQVTVRISFEDGKPKYELKIN